ncbi:protein phosphatase 2C domain-containing protein [Stackebrandtia soli]|uniref:protein phosphatase 2C domain-containing protein n=1 Tax=Stackebrandtia soli TaxID=1892856 RepID=UPI0039ECB469
MRTAAATRPSPGTPNDDAFVTGPNFAIVLDGATAPRSRDSGCGHDVPWLVARVAGHTAARLLTSTAPLPELLADAITATRADHADCDLSNPDSPSTTITIVRARPHGVDYLVLGDSPLLVETAVGLSPVIDDRVDHLPDYSYDSVAKLRNSPGGFWVASTRPEAARMALTGTIPTGQARRLLLLTDGASRLVERYGFAWADVLALAEQDGPTGLLDRVRAADDAAEGVRGKRFDDATAVLCHIDDIDND